MNISADKLAQLKAKQAKVMAMNASYKFRLAALTAIDNTVSEARHW